MAEEETETDRTEIECTLGALSVAVRTPDESEAEALFERLWERHLDESEEISTALQDRMRGHQ